MLGYASLKHIKLYEGTKFLAVNNLICCFDAPTFPHAAQAHNARDDAQVT